MNCLEGRSVILDEIQPKYFSYVVEWRNNPELNKYLTQPFKLTVELEKKWYEENYLQDDSQMLWILIDKKNLKPFGTAGYTDLNLKEKICIGGRLLLGEQEYSNHPAFIESFFVGSDYVYQFIDVQYTHIVREHKKALQLNKMFGFVKNIGEIKYPQKLARDDVKLVEMYRTKEMYLKVRARLFENLGEALFT